MTTVLVVDDEEAVRRHLRTILSSGGLEVVGEADDGAAAVPAVTALRPDVVLLDLRMPGRPGLDVLPELLALPGAPRVVVLTALADDRSVLGALAAGASGYLLKSTAPRDLVAVLRVVAAGHRVLSDSAAGELAPGAARALEADDLAARVARVLTARELDVLRCLAEGSSNAELAHRLDLQEVTVKGYVSAVMAKLGCSSRLQTGLLAQRAGLVGPTARRPGAGQPDSSGWASR